MSTEEHKATSRRFFEQAFNQGNLAVVDELVSSYHVYHDPDFPQPVRGPEGFKQYVQLFRTTFPDLHITVEELIAEGEKVTVRFTSTGTQQGELFGIPPTGKRCTVSGIIIGHFAGGKFAETWGIYDALGMLQQLGVVPAPGQAG